MACERAWGRETRLSSTLSESWTRGGGGNGKFRAADGVVGGLSSGKSGSRTLATMHCHERADDMCRPGGGVIKRKIRVPVHVDGNAVHCCSRLHDGDFMAMTCGSVEKDRMDGFGENVEALKDRGSCRDETGERRLQMEDGNMLEVVVSIIPTQGRACVRPKRASPVSRRG